MPQNPLPEARRPLTLDPLSHGRSVAFRSGAGARGTAI